MTNIESCNNEPFILYCMHMEKLDLKSTPIIIQGEKAYKLIDGLLYRTTVTISAHGITMGLSWYVPEIDPMNVTNLKVLKKKLSFISSEEQHD